MVNLSQLEDKSAGSAMVEMNVGGTVGVEKIGAFDYRICFDRDKFCVEDELIDSVESHLLISSDLYANLDTSMLYAGILLVSFNSVKFAGRREDVHSMIRQIIASIETATDVAVPLE